MSLLTCLACLQPICYNPKLVFIHVNTAKVLLVVKTLIKNIKSSHTNQQPWKLKAATKLICSYKSKIKIIAPSKNTFQNTGALQNCCLKKYISRLLSLKRFLLMSMNMKFFFTKWAKQDFLQKIKSFLQ